MARSDYTTADLLMEWQRYSDNDVWKFNQVVGAGVINSQWLPWIQAERDMVARSLTDAYEQMRDTLLYPIKPDFIVSEFVTIPTDEAALCDQILYTKYGYLQGFGTRATTSLSTGASITYSDADGDGTNDTATVIVSTAVSPDEIQVFFRTADGAPSAAHPNWRIPAYVTSDGSTATITFHRANCVQPSVWAIPFTSAGEFDGRNTANTGNTVNFITSVDVYRVYRDNTDGVQVMTFTGTNGAPEYTTVSASIVDAQQGGFVVTGSGTNQRGAIVASYEAGYPLSNQRINEELLTAFVRLASANMPLAAQSSSREGLVNHVWELDRTVYQDAFRENTMFGQMVGQIHAANVVARRKKYVGGYAP